MAASACGEDLTGGNTCPELCPEQSLPIEEVTLDAVVFDTTVGPFPVPGTEPGLVLASQAGVLDVRAVVRYDSLPRTYLFDGDTVPITSVDSARLRIRIDTASARFTGSVTLEAYDVDTTSADLDFDSLISLFRADRLLGSVEITRSELLLADTVVVDLPNADLADRIVNGRRLRIGLRLVGDGELTIHSMETGLPAALLFDPAPGVDGVATRTIRPISRTPEDDEFVATDLNDFSLPVLVPDEPDARLTVGGLPASRAYLRLVVPPFYLDSVILVRAQLSIVQRPVMGFDDTVTSPVFPVAVSSSALVTDLRRAAALTYAPLSFGVDPIAVAPRDSGERRIDLVEMIRAWGRSNDLDDPPVTAIVLRGALEGRARSVIAFYGLDAPAELRPKLHLSFVRRSRFGIP